MKSALIGYTGVIGSILNDSMRFDSYYNSKNIEMLQDEFDLVVCAAPSGNRLAANQSPEQDLNSVFKILAALVRSRAKKIILISTVDTINFPDTAYGNNRRWLENYVKYNFPSYHIVRLCSLIGKTITKNPLYDLKHNKYVEKINRNSVIHWYPLENLHNDLELVVKHNIKEINLTSEPIRTGEVVEKFFPYLYDLTAESNNPHIYDIKTEQYSLFNQTVPYAYTKQQIFEYMQNYLA